MIARILACLAVAVLAPVAVAIVAAGIAWSAGENLIERIAK